MQRHHNRKIITTDINFLPMNLKYVLLRIAGVLLIAFIFQTTNGQVNFKQGYVIKQSGDTLHGFIDFRNWKVNPVKISFKENLNGENVNYTPLDIRCFSVLDEIYESALIETEISPSNIQNLEFGAELNLKVDTAFLQAMILGKKSLYFYVNNQGNSQFYIKIDSTFKFLAYKKYIKKVDAENVSRQTKETKIFENQIFLGQLILYLNDCPDIKPMIEKTKYTKKSLETLFNFYYDCTQSKVQFQKSIEKIKTEFGVVAGLSLTSIAFSGDIFPYLVDAEFEQSLNFSAGIAFNLIIPGTNGTLLLNNELAFSSYKIDGYNLSVYHADKYTASTTALGFSYLKMNNMVRFCYPINDFSVFCNAGISNGYGFNETNYLYQEVTFFTTFTTEEGKALDKIRKSEFGYGFGLGTKYKKFSVEYRYEIANGMSDYVFLQAKTKRSFFLLGYTF